MATTRTNKTTAKKVSANLSKANKKVEKQQAEAQETISENIESVQSFVRKAFLASLGAVGRTVEELQTRYTDINSGVQQRFEKINEDGQSFVKELVDRGEKVQDDAEGILKEGRANIEEQIEVAKKRLGGIVSVVDIPSRLQEMSDRLETLSKDLKKSA
jgi:polyhydroxyalkanoate synthesis regulator phasin